MRTPTGPRPSGYRRRPATRARERLIDAFANELRLGDRVTNATLPGPERLPARLLGRTGVVVELGRVRVGLRYGESERTEYVDPHALLVVAAIDGRHLFGPTRATS